MKSILFTLIIIFGLTGFVQAKHDVSKVVAFINHNHTLNVPKSLYDKGILTVYNVDEFEDAELSLSAMLQQEVLRKTSPSKLQTLTEAQLATLYQNAFQMVSKKPQYKAVVSTLEQSSESLMQLAFYDIKALPAVVVNDKYVLYGVSDVNKALKKVHHFIRAQDDE